MVTGSNIQQGRVNNRPVKYSDENALFLPANTTDVLQEDSLSNEPKWGLRIPLGADLQGATATQSEWPKGRNLLTALRPEGLV